MIFYVAHPLGTGSARLENLEKAKRWLAYLLREYPDKAFCMPWVPYAEVLPDQVESHRRGLRDDLEILTRCDGIVLCGGRISPGMQQELDHHVRTSTTAYIMNLNHLGEEPPL